MALHYANLHIGLSVSPGQTKLGRFLVFLSLPIDHIPQRFSFPEA